MKGIVKWFSVEKGYGFILSTEENGGKEYFVHHSSIIEKGVRQLFENQRVEFTPTIDDKGRKQAKNVKKILDKK